jgi:hypothetical protein
MKPQGIPVMRQQHNTFVTFRLELMLVQAQYSNGLML